MTRQAQKGRNRNLQSSNQATWIEPVEIRRVEPVETMSKSADLGRVPKANQLHPLNCVSGVMELADSPISL
jgi:hypothetical protein